MKIIRWEYKTTIIDPKTPVSLLMEHLDLEGSAGWELVHIKPPQTGSGNQQKPTPYRLIFKRPCGYVDEVVE
jgi:hypothetical protein